MERAAQFISEGLNAAPGDLELLSLRVAERFLADDRPGTDAAKKAVFSLNPEFSQLYSIVSEFADWEHRYDEIVRMMREAVALDSEDGVAYGELGLNLIRAEREKHYKSAKEFHREAGLSFTYARYADIEAGKPPFPGVDNALQFLKLFGLTLICL